ncbi:MAG TPA: DUF1614 domain-containing protein [Oscillatoriales cyanobacterium M59_W2019_021]|nr:DUF1614 domain-containing protein [Oscillatoriales cyanobacterium M59_W2019_021]
MIYLPVTLLLFLALILLLPFIWVAIAIDLVEVAVAKLGFSPNVAFLLFMSIMVGSTINIPLYRRTSEASLVPDFADLWLRQFWGIPLYKMRQETVVALNVGGGLIPVLLALYELTRSDPIAIFLVTALVTFVSYFSAQIVPGIGIQMNALVAPLTASLAAVLLAGVEAPSVAFAGGVLGVLIGADLLHLPDIERMTPGVLSIGGAGVFDGIALCGLFALLLT